MKIDLEPDVEKWLKKQVARGRFSSLDEALGAGVVLLRQIDDNARDIDDDWVKPYIDQALSQVQRGEVRQWKKGDLLKEIHAKHPRLSDADNH